MRAGIVSNLEGPMNAALRALIVDERKDEVQRLVSCLEDAGYRVTWDAVDTAVDMERAMDGREWDIVFCNDLQPHVSGPEVLESVRNHRADLPLVFVSGTNSATLAAAALETGLQIDADPDAVVRLPPMTSHEPYDTGPAIEAPLVAALPAFLLLFLAVTGALSLLAWLFWLLLG